ncbi:MAG: hypothetical protein BWY09_00377 [Candidatus Hydrogenedentes bacterium ADurb.Bin179]|nr:MAG: hypothetical protein BWY09_00377 [Candidatus Hydrogenedentes bacterium ADurb.Bin179]
MRQSHDRFSEFKGCEFKNSKTVTSTHDITTSTASGKAKFQTTLFKNKFLRMQFPLSCLHHAKRFHCGLEDARSVHFKNGPPPGVDFQCACSQLYCDILTREGLYTKAHCHK